MFQTKRLLKSSNINTDKITIVELKLISVSPTIILLFGITRTTMKEICSKYYHYYSEKKFLETIETH